MKPIADIKKEFDEQFKDVRAEMNHLDSHIGQKPGYLWGAFRHDVLDFVESTLTQDREELRDYIVNYTADFCENSQTFKNDLLTLLQEKPDTQGK